MELKTFYGAYLGRISTAMPQSRLPLKKAKFDQTTKEQRMRHAQASYIHTVSVFNNVYFVLTVNLFSISRLTKITQYTQKQIVIYKVIL